VLVVMTTGGVPQTFHRAAFGSMAPLLGRTAPVAAVADPGIVLDLDRYVGRYASSSTLVDVVRVGDELVASITWGPASDAPVVRPGLVLRAVDHRVMITPLDGRDYVLVFPSLDEPCDHVLAALRLLRREEARRSVDELLF